ncbi:hypothetical protein CEXT_654471 [Caerostris extrusa]|uniref:Uncharacterized protein n=1 Tax=Caerostris extrusa TaxID=172846 RepID=A0AAV4WZQ9_CAEEX|nr:hypothetical protein CEXT_654471 [Caerostris extrusa]
MERKYAFIALKNPSNEITYPHAILCVTCVVHGHQRRRLPFFKRFFWIYLPSLVFMVIEFDARVRVTRKQIYIKLYSLFISNEDIHESILDVYEALYEDYEALYEDYEALYDDTYETVYENVYEALYEDIYEALYEDIYEALYEDVYEALYEDTYEAV